MATPQEWLAGVTATGARLPPGKVARYRARHDAQSTTTHTAPPRITQSRPPKPCCKKPPGPGAELTKLLKSLGIQGCGLGCEGWSAKMDAWGPQGCLEHKQEIIDRLAAKQAAAGWATTVKAAGMALLTGLALRINLDHPIEWLVDESIRRAEENAACCKTE